MRIILHESVPERERRWIRRLIRRCADVWGLDGWEISVQAKTFRGKHDFAECLAFETSHTALITLRPDRFEQRAAMRDDLLHELWHIVSNGMDAVFDDVVTAIPNEEKRRRIVRRAHRRWEIHHDRVARMWGKVL